MEAPSETHKNPKIWLIATVIVVVVAIVGVAIYWQKIKTLRQPTETRQTKSSAEQAKAASDELKQIDLAALKASITEIQSVLKAFK